MHTSNITTLSELLHEKQLVEKMLKNLNNHHYQVSAFSDTALLGGSAVKDFASYVSQKAQRSSLQHGKTRTATAFALLSPIIMVGGCAMALADVVVFCFSVFSEIINAGYQIPRVVFECIKKEIIKSKLKNIDKKISLKQKENSSASDENQA